MSEFDGSRLLQLEEIEGDSHVVCVLLVSLIALIHFHWLQHDSGLCTRWDADSDRTKLDVGAEVAISLFSWSNCACRIRSSVEANIEMGLSGSAMYKHW